MLKLNEFALRFLPYISYYPDLKPSYYFIFLEECFPGKEFMSNEEIERETDSYFSHCDKWYYKMDTDERRSLK